MKIFKLTIVSALLLGAAVFVSGCTSCGSAICGPIRQWDPCGTPKKVYRPVVVQSSCAPVVETSCAPCGN